MTSSGANFQSWALVFTREEGLDMGQERGEEQGKTLAIFLADKQKFSNPVRQATKTTN